jgi:hypothetical protein
VKREMSMLHPANRQCNERRREVAAWGTYFRLAIRPAAFDFAEVGREGFAES